MIEEQYPSEAREIAVDLVDHGLATLREEVQLLCWLAERTSGNVLEIGTHLGVTTRGLARRLTNRIIFSVDWVAPKHMLPEQEKEMPTLETVGLHARGCPNVFFALQDSKTFDYTGKNIGLVFIDGDHSWDGVSGDTALALDAYRAGLTARPFIIAWHDVYDHENWVAVKRYLESRFAPNEVRSVTGTHMAILTLP